jgi:triacylglycerol esterase/lipase EstA (alpha/beta hydrolase family)
MDTNQQPPNQALTSWLTLGVSALNGVLGDYLSEHQNGLAITMGCYHNGVPLALTRASLRRALPVLTPKMCVLIHGLAFNEDSWRFSGQQPGDQPSSYGSLLQQDLGYTPFYLRYNTGLRVSENGKHLATLLSELCAAYPMPIEEIVLIGHSMGGLVIRSACHYGGQHHSRWIQRIRRIFYLGTPHEGAALERAGNALSSALGAVPHPIPRLIRKVVNLRSQGVKDLRFGNLVDDDWRNHDPDSYAQNKRTVVAWLPSAEHYLIAGTLTKDPKHIATQIFGDLLVELTSAYCETTEDSPVTAAHMKLFPGVHHMKLARHPEVYQQIKSWCAS